MASWLLRNGRVVDPSQGLDGPHDILIVNGRIAELRPVGARVSDAPGSKGRGVARAARGAAKPVPAGAHVVDLAGRIVTPGLVDMHVHLREPGQEHKEIIETGTRAAAAGGFTSVACMPNTDPVNDSLSVTEYIVAEARRRGAVNVYPIGAVSKGSAGEELAEIGDMVRAGAVAVSDDGRPVSSSHLMRMALEYTRLFDIPVINHCEDRSLSAGGVMNEGTASTLLGLKGIPAASESIMVARDLRLLELTGGRLHLAHLSTRASLDEVRRARAKGAKVTCEATPHHLVLTEEEVVRSRYDSATKMNPPLRAEEDRLALLHALEDGTVDVIATDHAPHHADEKLVEFDDAPFGIVGLETAVALVMDRLVRPGHIDLSRMVELMALNPARILGLKKGTLAVGADADLTVIDPETTRAVEPDRFESRSRNTPFTGWKLRGWPVMTFVGGRLAHDARDAAGRAPHAAREMQPRAGKSAARRETRTRAGKNPRPGAR
ncbi:MAG TPA: dihydroorotase [Verrucomicrobiae bacterium]|nr:dihydroorotase [Verrucomicrobiae bacterium]